MSILASTFLEYEFWANQPIIRKKISEKNIYYNWFNV